MTKPFIKWAGGKQSLIPQLSCCLPHDTNISTYIEPFLGGGAMLLFLLQERSDIKEVFVNDINYMLINTWKVVKTQPFLLLDELRQLSTYYLSLSEDKRSPFYYKKRNEFNNSKITRETAANNVFVKEAALFIFLNKTCFNGLWRVNKHGRFNVPFGKYNNPKIFDAENIINVSRLIQKVEFFSEDYNCFLKSVFFDLKNHKETFVYFDPPYRPLTKTAAFTGYTKGGFDDGSQISLAKTFSLMAERPDVYLMLSNSDPKNTDKDDNFFDDLYSEQCINRVNSRRNISASAIGRKNVFEIVVTNYTTKPQHIYRGNAEVSRKAS